MEQMLLQTVQDATRQVTITSIINICLVAAIVAAVFIILSVVRKRLKNKLPLENDLRRLHMYTTVFRIVKVLVLISGVIAILQVLGINISGIAGGIGVVVVIFLLAMKDSFQDLFSGFTIMTDKYFSVGDAVEFDGKDGIVISFTVRTTKIEFLDDRSVMSVANRNISKIRKLTHMVDIDLPLPYELDRKSVYDTLSPICDQISRLEGVESCELKGTQSFADSAILYKIRFFCEPKDRPDIRRAVIKTIQDGLEKAGVQIPYRQLDIHTK